MVPPTHWSYLLSIVPPRGHAHCHATPPTLNPNALHRHCLASASLFLFPHKSSPLYLLCTSTQSCECGRREAHGHAVCSQVQALICPQGVSHCQLAVPSHVPLNNHTLFSFLKPAVCPLFSLLSAEDPNMGNKDFPGITGAVRGKSHVLPPTHLSRGQCLGPCSLSSSTYYG